MAPRTLPEPMRAYRIGDPGGQFDVYSGDGASLFPGRWNASGQRVVYASEHYSTALLEKLVHTRRLPPRQHFIEITLPAATSYEIATADLIPDWWKADGDSARAFGARWVEERRSAILLVPSILARMERNILINLAHTDAARIKVGLETPVWWDERLFAAT